MNKTSRRRSGNAAIGEDATGNSGFKRARESDGQRGTTVEPSMVLSQIKASCQSEFRRLAIRA